MPTLGVAVFGASVYEHHGDLDNPRFANSAKEFIKVVGDPAIVADSKVEILNLYDEPLAPGVILDKITDFVSSDYDNIIIYYCGHGDVPRSAGEYRVFLRGSKRDRRGATLLDIYDLIKDVERIPERKKIYFVLDGCYSGAVIKQMREERMDAGGAEALLERGLSEIISSSGTAIFAATGGVAVALAKTGDDLSLFTGAIVGCLRDGVAHRSDLAALSWLDLRDEVVRVTRERIGPDAPVPTIYTLTERGGDITRVPFFVNRRYKSQNRSEDERLYWRNISEDSLPFVFEDFLKKFPDGIFAPLAHDLLRKRINRFSETEIESYLRDYPRTEAKKRLSFRLVALKWERIESSIDIAELERFAAAFPRSEFAGKARDRVAALEKELAEIEAWWERIKTSVVPEEFRQFLKLHSDSKFGGLARARLAELSATSDNKTSWAASLLGWILASAPSFRENWHRFAAVATLLAFGVAAVLLMTERNPTVSIQGFRSDFVAAGDDPGKLRNFISRCAAASCPFEQEARDRLTKREDATRSAQLVEAALDTAGIDLGQLRKFVQQCNATSCAVAQEANLRLAKAEEAERIRVARIAETDHKALDAARTDLGLLRKFVQDCNATSCTVAQLARDLLAKAEDAERARLAQIAQADRRALDAAGTDLGQLRKFVQQCNATCTVAQEARDRLARAEDIAKNTKPLGFNTFRNSDINQNDIEVTFDISYANCNSKCASNNECVAFVFNKWKNACFLKNKVGPLIQDPRSDAVIRTDQARPGLATTKIETCAYHGSSMIGDVSRSSGSQSTATCRSECEANQSCVAYTFRKADRQCSFFSSVSDRKKDDPTSDSGSRMQNPC